MSYCDRESCFLLDIRCVISLLWEKLLNVHLAISLVKHNLSLLVHQTMVFLKVLQAICSCSSLVGIHASGIASFKGSAPSSNGCYIKVVT